MALIVYGTTLSPFVRKVCVLLQEKGLAYELEQVSPISPPPDYEQISPLKRIPGFRDTSLPEPNGLADSTVICDYLETKYPEPALYPKDAYQRARALWFEEYADTILGACITRGLFFERVVKKLRRLEADEMVCRKTIDVDLPPVFDYLERELGDKPFYVGDSFSIADISVGTMLANFGHLEAFEDKRWPRLGGFGHRVLARPSFAGLIEREVPFLKRILAA